MALSVSEPGVLWTDLIHHKARQQIPAPQVLQSVQEGSAGHQLLRRDVEQLQGGPLLVQLLQSTTASCTSLHQIHLPQARQLLCVLDLRSLCDTRTHSA